MVIMFTHAAFDGKLWPRPPWPFVFVNLNFNAITATVQSWKKRTEQNYSQGARVWKPITTISVRISKVAFFYR